MLISIAVGIACKLSNVSCVWHIRENPGNHIPKIILKLYGAFGYFFSNQIIVDMLK